MSTSSTNTSTATVTAEAPAVTKDVASTSTASEAPPVSPSPAAAAANSGSNSTGSSTTTTPPASPGLARQGRQTIDMFLTSALEKIVKGSNEKSPQLLEHCKQSYEAINTKLKRSLRLSQSTKSEKEIAKDLDIAINKLVDTFKLACDTKLPKVMIIALDCLQKLISFGYIRGQMVTYNGAEKKLVDKVIDIIGSWIDFPDENVQLQTIKALLAVVITPNCGVHENSLLSVFNSCYSIFLNPRNVVNQTTAKATLTQISNFVFQRMTTNNEPTTPSSEKKSAQEPETNGKEPETNGTSHSSTSEPSLSSLVVEVDPDVAYMDSYLIFNALCNQSVESRDVKGKILALELLLMILDSYGPVLRENERFITNAIKKHLCMSILMNGVSSEILVFKLSLSLFSSLIVNFKDHLKDEIGVFFPKIFLQILESPNSTWQQKNLVMQVLLKICKMPQTLVDIFLNYDCDPNAGDIFERMVKDVSQIAKGIQNVDQSLQQDTAMKSLALECSVTILQSLVDWSKELDEKKDTKKADVDDEKIELLKEEVLKFEKQKQTKQLLEIAKQQFKEKPNKAVKYLISCGVLENSPASVAKWLKTTDDLDKEMIGEYLGDRDDFNKEVLREYMDSMEFKGIELDEAFRQLFLAFRLPKDSILIDRIILKFAEKYVVDNPDKVFANADSAYFFAFAVVLLATDLHNPRVKRKMQKPSWKSSLRGQNDGKDYPEQFLMEVYDRIAAAPFLTADDMILGIQQPIAVNSENLDTKQRQLLFAEESQRMVKKSQQMIEMKMKNKSEFFKSVNIEHVKPMFEMSWCAMLATLSLVLESTEEPKLIELCLEGFKCAIHVASLFYLETQRDAFVSSLVKFTLLNNVAEIKQKNIECIKALMQIASVDGNYLKESWLQVLSCISQLERLNLVGSVKESPFSKPGEINRLDAQQLAELNTAAIIAQQIDPARIDRIFTSTVELNNDAIVHFVQCLCQVSLQEINSSIPRTFSLQKLVEIASFNMDRMRLVWSQIWTILTHHFTTVGCDPNLNIAMYAIDSLRQLATKFLEKEELANYNFQKDFFKPFEFIITKSSGVQIRELVIRCLSNIILSRTANIRSGWKSMFTVFSYAALDPELHIAQLAFEIVEKIGDTYFDLISKKFFPAYCNSLVAFADNAKFPALSIKGIKALGICSRKLAEGQVCAFADPAAPIFMDCDIHLKLWWPILTGLAKVVSHEQLDVRSQALSELFDIVRTYGNQFDNAFWELAFRGVILPMFDNVRYVGSSEMLKQESEWLQTTCLSALTNVIELFSFYFDKLSFLSNDVLTLLASCILLDNEKLATIGSTCLLRLVMLNGTKWTHEMWTIICVALDHIVRNNMALELLASHNIDVSKYGPTNSPPPISGTEEHKNHIKVLKQKLIRSTPAMLAGGQVTFSDNTQRVIGKTNIQLVLVQSISDITIENYECLTTEHIFMLAASLKSTYMFSYKSNNHKAVWENNDNRSKFGALMIKQEEASLINYLKILFRLYADTTDPERPKKVEPKLVKLINQIIKEFIGLEVVVSAPNHTPDELQYYQSRVPVLELVLTQFHEFTNEQFLKHVPQLYPLFAKLILSETKIIRQVLKGIFVRIGKLNNLFKK